MVEAGTVPAQALREGILRLRRGSLLLIIASAIRIGGDVAAAAAPALLSTLLGASPATLVLALSAVVAIASLVLGLIGIYAYVVPAYGMFSDYSVEKFGTVSRLVKVGYLGGLSLFILAFVLILASVAAGTAGYAGVLLALGLAVLAALFIAVILMIIGKAGIAAGSFRLGNVTSETLFIVAGVFFIISLIIDIAAIVFKPALLASTAAEFLAWIFTYVACGSAVRMVGGASAGG